MAKLSAHISSLLEKPIKVRELLGDTLEQANAHAKTPMKVALRKYRILDKITPHQLVVAFYPLPSQFLTAENRTTMFWPLIGMHKQ
jgi:hypothetical protein